MLKACRDSQIDVPGRLSIVGFDDIFGADLVTPSLTTVRSPLAYAGEAAVRTLASGMDSPLEPSALRTTFIPRESTGALG